jgi:hypothetical protein
MKEEQFKHLGEAQFHADFILLSWLSLIRLRFSTIV